MVVKLHLHSSFPQDQRRPNAALGYLKSALSEEKNLDVTNIYWYLMPPKLMNSMSAILANLYSGYGPESFRSPIFAAYLCRFLLKTEPKKKNAFNRPTIIESALSSRMPLEKVENTARTFRNFVDYTIEAKNMADVDIAGFTINLYQWITNWYVWSNLKRLNPNIIILAGGLDTPEEAVLFMEKFKDIDLAIWGEGEVPLRELVRHFDDKHSLDRVPRLVYRKRNELHFTSAPDERLEKHLIADHTDYFNRLRELNLTTSPEIPIVSSRSCRWNRCKFCVLNKGVAYHERPVKDVVKEIEYQSKKHNINRFFFTDSDIGRKTDKEFEELLRSLLESVAERKAFYEIMGGITPIRLTRKNTEMMSKIKMSVQMGFEAMTDPILKGMDKMHRVAENIQALKFGNDAGISLIGLNVIRNLPGVGEEDVMESIENLGYLRFFLNRYRLKITELNLFKRAPYYEEISPEEKEERWVESSMYTELERLGLIKEDDRWDFFGFQAHSLYYHHVWDQFAITLEKLQSSDIRYTWSEFPDGSSLVQEHNQMSGNRKYFLDAVETRILKFCDSIKNVHQLKNEFPQENVEEIISPLIEENLLYFEKERARLLSILSTKAIQKL